VKDNLIRSDNQRIDCKWCKKSFSPLLRYCPECGHSNEDFFRWAIHEENRQRFIELWVDVEVWRAIKEHVRSHRWKSEADFVSEAISRLVSDLFREGK
jgi:primosomal protein N'